MKIRIDGFTNLNVPNIAIRCPHCGHFGTFESITHTGITQTNHASHILGVKKCPNTICKGQLFYIFDYNTKRLLQTFPTDAIPFDKEKIPEKVLNAFEEAVKCHSTQCFIASAIMIRKTLEEICFDRGAKGRNLKEKITDLGGKILIPNELLMGLDELRLLGNDAAHIEAKTFAEIGIEEIEVSIDFTKEILKAVYQYESLLNKLRNLKERNNVA